MTDQDDSLAPETASRLERAVLTRIRREHLIRRLLWLGTFGALSVALTLVRPLLHPGGTPASPSESGEASG